MLDELEAYALLDKLGVPRAPSIALDADISSAPALPFSYPVAVIAGPAEADARKFLEFLKGAQATAVFEKRGFGIAAQR